MMSLTSLLALLVFVTVVAAQYGLYGGGYNPYGARPYGYGGNPYRGYGGGYGGRGYGGPGGFGGMNPVQGAIMGAMMG